MPADTSQIATSTPRSAGRIKRRLERHDRAVLAAEVRRLIHELGVGGPMPAPVLAGRARRWREGAFEEAVRPGVARRVRRSSFSDRALASSDSLQ